METTSNNIEVLKTIIKLVRSKLDKLNEQQSIVQSLIDCCFLIFDEGEGGANYCLDDNLGLNVGENFIEIVEYNEDEYHPLITLKIEKS